MRNYNRVKAVQIAEDIVDSFVNMLKAKNAQKPSEMRAYGMTFNDILEQFGATYSYENTTKSIQKLVSKLFTEKFLTD